MIPIAGDPVDITMFDAAKRVQERPLLTVVNHWRTPDANYLSCWVDVDEQAIRWMVFEVSLEEASEITDAMVDKETFNTMYIQICRRHVDDTVYLLDADMNRNVIAITSLPMRNVPADYRPAM